MMFLREPHFDGIYIYTEKVDFRKSIDGLSGLVEQEFCMSPTSRNLFVFFSRRRDRIKILYWDFTGFALWYKRLEKDKFLLPRRSQLKSSQQQITSEQLGWLLEGYDIWKMKPHVSLNYEIPV